MGLRAVGVAACFLLACSTAKVREGFTNLPADGGSGGGDRPDTGPPLPPTGDGGEAVCTPSKLNYDIPGNNCDDDGDGQVDNAVVCDSGLALDGNAEGFASALGICRSASDGGWGLISATFLDGYNTTGKPNDGQHGIMPKFGSVLTPREGGSLGVLSSGWAREYNNKNGTYDKYACFRSGATMGSYMGGSVPSGYPKSIAGCDADTDVYDVIVIRMKLRAPGNAKGLSFNFNFMSGEWPEYVCTNYNDGFLAMLTSKAFNNGVAENISFDPQQRPVSVNNGFFDRCQGGTTTCGRSTCAGGDGELWGTGFYCPGVHCYSGTTKEDTGGGATGWLETQAPIEPGEEITLDFMIWDTGDASFDSSVLLDNFQWIAGETKTYTDRPR